MAVHTLYRVAGFSCGFYGSPDWFLNQGVGTIGITYCIVVGPTGNDGDIFIPFHLDLFHGLGKGGDKTLRSKAVHR